MYLVGLLLIIVLILAATTHNWRLGLYGMIIVGMLQDPVRKLTPGAPSYLVIATVPVWAVMMFRMFATERHAWSGFTAAYPQIARLSRWFFIALVIPALLSATYGRGSWQLTVVGAFAYGSLFAGWLIGYAFPLHAEDIHRLLRFYCISAAVMLIGVPLEYWELFPEWPGLGTRAMGTIWGRHTEGLYVRLIAGLFRSPDVMGWHAATMTMLALTLALSSRGKLRVPWTVLAGWGFVGLMLCGRRKMIWMLPVFLVVLLWIFLQNRHGKGRAFGYLVRTLLLVSIVGSFLYGFVGRSSTVEDYYLREGGSVTDRVKSHALYGVAETYRQNGFWGAGLGTATQGTHHLDVERPRTWQEGGIGRLLVELGVPGLICLLVLGIFLIHRVIGLVKEMDFHPLEHPLYAGLTAFFLANAGSFVVSHQIYGDPFVATFFACLIGILLSVARLERPVKTTMPESLLEEHLEFVDRLDAELMVRPNGRPGGRSKGRSNRP